VSPLRMKWLKTSHLAINVAICRHFSIYISHGARVQALCKTVTLLVVPNVGISRADRVVGGKKTTCAAPPARGRSGGVQALFRFAGRELPRAVTAASRARLLRRKAIASAVCGAPH
jgi:hypothetical protein